jgi:Ca2+-dependent lipid-binding protein
MISKYSFDLLIVKDLLVIYFNLVLRAEGLASADINGKSDPFCVIQLINQYVQTHTEYKTLSPEWGKLFEL